MPLITIQGKERYGRQFVYPSSKGVSLFLCSTEPCRVFLMADIEQENLLLGRKVDLFYDTKRCLELTLKKFKIEPQTDSEAWVLVIENPHDKDIVVYYEKK